MVEKIDQPCKDGLSPACFAQEPAFARRAFAFRLLSAFSPPQLSKRLITFLGLTRFDPFGILPDWLQLPPWFILLPGAIIPPGWKIGDPPFEGLLVSPDYWGGLGYFSPLGPTYINSLSLFTGPPSPGIRPPVFPSLYDPFSSLNTSFWDVWEEPGTTVSHSGSQVSFFSPSSPDYCSIRASSLGFSVPPRWVSSLMLNIFSFGGVLPFFEYWIDIGIHRIHLQLLPPNEIIFPNPDSTRISVDSFADAWTVWKIYYSSGSASLYRDSALIVSDVPVIPLSTHPGRLTLDNFNECSSLLDWISFIEY